MDEKLVDIRQTIIKARKEKGITQTQLANLAGIRVATISTFEAGKKEMRTDTLSKIMAILALHISPISEDVFSDFTTLQADAKDTASILKKQGFGIREVRIMTQDQMYKLTNKDHILNFCDLSEGVFESMKNKNITEKGWYQYYRSVVSLELAVL